MPINYAVTEPHPSIPKSGAYIGGGRGGAGNIRRYQANEITNGQTATGPASRITLSRPFSKRNVVVAGRGGAGNMVNISTDHPEDRIFQFDEDMLQSREHVSPVYHIGRGGAGNCVHESSRHSSTAVERKNSTDSNYSTASDPDRRPAVNRLSMSSFFSRRS
jgi:hypothetical protein